MFSLPSLLLLVEAAGGGETQVGASPATSAAAAGDAAQQFLPQKELTCPSSRLVLILLLGSAALRGSNLAFIGNPGPL